MTTLFLRRISKSEFRLDDSHSEHAAERFPIGGVCKAEVTLPRSVAHHRLFFAIQRYLVDNTDMPSQAYALDWLKIQTGHFDTHIVMAGDEVREVLKPRSISFASMDQQEFAEWFERAMDVIAERLSCEPDEVRDGVNAYAEGLI